MTTQPPPLTPQQRLARNRQQIVAEMRGESRSQSERKTADQASGSHRGTWAMLRHTLRAWWRAHPARLLGRQVVRAAEPSLQALAREQPLRLMALAAGAGVAAAVLRPWRLVSLGALAAVLLRPVDLPSLIGALLAPDTPGNPAQGDAPHG